MEGSLQPGAQIGGARIVRVLGSGDVATVYEVLYAGTRRAMKVIETDLAEGASSTIQARAAQESEAISMIEHVNVVRWFDTGFDQGRVWILLELVEGSNLHQLRIDAGGRLPVEQAVSLARQVCEGLVAVHKKGFVHRDMKPENILVTNNGLAKVGDLGSVKLPGWGVKTTNAHRLTSMAYKAPELWRGEPPEPRNDVYAMGLIIYEMITGTNPVVPRLDDLITMFKRHREYEPPPLMSVAEGVPDDLSALVQRAMCKTMEQRCTMRELADGLEVVLDRLLVWRRTAARSVPLPKKDKDPALAMTLPMPALPGFDLYPRVSARGTMVMQAAPAPDHKTSSDETPTDRDASPPPAPPPPPEPVSVPSTLRTPSRPLPAPLAAEPELPRRSTGIPVESTMRPSGAPRRRIVGLIFGGALATLAIVAWWALHGEQAPKPMPAGSPPPVVPTSASPIGSAVKPPSSASATPPRPARRPPVAPHR